MVRQIVTAVLIAGGLALASSNTVEGLGEDVESVGETVSNTAD